MTGLFSGRVAACSPVPARRRPHARHCRHPCRHPGDPAGRPAAAAATQPEIDRKAAPPQAQGKLHTLRTIPEACATLTGVFTGKAERPYALDVRRTSPNCQARARLVDAAKAGASAEAGWILHDRIRVPSAACESRRAVVEVWRRPGGAGVPTKDGQGQARIYLKEGIAKAKAGELAALPVYAVQLAIEGKPCR